MREQRSAASSRPKISPPVHTGRRTVRVGVPPHLVTIYHCIGQPDSAVMVQAHEDAASVGEELHSEAPHGATEHAHSVGDIRACLRGAVEKRAHKGHKLTMVN
eukprot:6180015-Pleurochrysis_carterae.AAC.5